MSAESKPFLQGNERTRRMIVEKSYVDMPIIRVYRVIDLSIVRAMKASCRWVGALSWRRFLDRR
jgi:hypothetical protein